MITRWRMPPESSCGICAHPVAVDPDEREEVAGAPESVTPVHALVRLHHVHELVADAHDRIEGAHRALEHHRDVPPAVATELPRAQPSEIDAAEPDLPAGHLGRRTQDLQDRVRRRGLAAARLAGEADDLACSNRQVDVIDRAECAVGLQVVDDEVVELQQRLLLDFGHGRERYVVHEAGHRAAFRRRKRGFASSSTPKLMNTSAATESASATPGKTKCHQLPWRTLELFCAQ